MTENNHMHVSNGLPATPETLARSLESASDDTLRAVIREARTILAAREEQQKKEALAQIRQLAKVHGLDIAVKKPLRKRGRPPKGGLT